jgi:protocatechuate 3,4-dioxygenase beta subunit
MSKVLVDGRAPRRLRALALIAAGATLAWPASAFAQRARPSRPATMAWQGTIAPAGEPGEPLVVAGTVYGADGTTPAPGVVVYAYQTDARGLYTPDGKPGVPRLYGFARTDAQGRYEFRTIRPASYPGQNVPAHIHMTVDSGSGEQEIAEIQFQGDPLLPADRQQKMAAEGRWSALCRAERDGAGVPRCTRNIQLPR